MLSQKEILQFAVKGLESEIEKLETSIKQGYKLISQIDNGEKVKTTKPRHEILAAVTEKADEKEKLEKEKFNLEWQLENEQ